MKKTKILIIILVIILITAIGVLLSLMNNMKNENDMYITKGNIKILKQENENQDNLGYQENQASNISNAVSNAQNTANYINSLNSTASTNTSNNFANSQNIEDDIATEYETVTNYSDSSETGFNQVVEKYLGDLFENSKKISTSNQAIQQIAGILDEECISENGLTSSNLKEKLQLFTFNYKINEITYVRESDYYMTFKVNVRFTDNSNNNYDRTFFFAIDLYNSTYKIYFGKNTNYRNNAEIKANEYNIYRAV